MCIAAVMIPLTGSLLARRDVEASPARQLYVRERPWVLTPPGGYKPSDEFFGSAGYCNPAAGWIAIDPTKIRSIHTGGVSNLQRVLMQRRDDPLHGSYTDVRSRGELKGSISTLSHTAGICVPGE